MEGRGTYEMIKRYSTLFLAELDGEILCGQAYISDGTHFRWLIGASKRLNVGRERATLIGNANRLLIWEAIKYAREKGHDEFDFGGYYMGTDTTNPKLSINFFKKSFGGEFRRYYNYIKYYSRLFKLVKNLSSLER